MAAIITNKLRIFNAMEFLQSINRSAPNWKPNNSYAEGDVVVNNQNSFIALGNSSGTSTSGVSAGDGGNGPTPDTLQDGTVQWAHQGQSVYNMLYMAIGKQTPWLNDSNPPTPEDSIGYSYRFKYDTIALKKVNYNDMTLAIPRINWTSGRVYTMYEHDNPEEIIPNGYVIVASGNQFNVYKCINNQKYDAAAQTVTTVASTIQPSTTGTEIEETADGYKWKFMYAIDLQDSLKFLTKDYIPVKNLLEDPVAPGTAAQVQWDIKQAASQPNPGQIEHVKIMPNEEGGAIGGGLGYHPNIQQIGSVALTGNVVSIAGVDGATDYTGYDLIDLGNQEQFEITQWNVTGTTAAVTVNGSFTGGTGRDILVAPGVNISGNGSSFSAYGLVVDQRIEKIVITNTGANWSAVDNATIDVNNVPAYNFDGTLNVNACKVKPIVSPETGHGFNPAEELGGYYVMTAIKLEYDEQSTRENSSGDLETKIMFPVEDSQAQFRQIAIVADPDAQIPGDGSTPANEESYRGPQHPFFGDDLGEPFDIVTGTGKVLYIENRQPVSRAIDQIEDIKVVFEF